MQSLRELCHQSAQYSATAIQISFAPTSIPPLWDHSNRSIIIFIAATTESAAAAGSCPAAATAAGPAADNSSNSHG